MNYVSGSTRLFIFDLNGTLMRAKSGKTFPTDENDFEAIPGRQRRVWDLIDGMRGVAVATNQGGLAFGYHGTGPFFERTPGGGYRNPFMHGIEEFLLREFHIGSNYVRICPHHPNGTVSGLGIECVCRKPQPYMLLDLMQQFNATREETVFIGDRSEDKLAADNAGVEFLLANEFFGDEQ